MLMVFVDEIKGRVVFWVKISEDEFDYLSD